MMLNAPQVFACLLLPHGLYVGYHEPSGIAMLYWPEHINHPETPKSEDAMDVTSLFHRKPEYTNQQGSVVYIDGSHLNRPLSMPRWAQILTAVIVAVGVVIGIKMGSDAIGTVAVNNANNQATLETNLTRSVSYNLPVMSTLAGVDNETILANLNNQGYIVYNQTAEGSTGLDLVKLPADVTLADAATMYAKGVASLSAADAAKLLNGSWTLSIDRSDGETISVKYADFSSSSLEAAISSAIVAAGFDPATTPENGKGTDDLGNTYQTGTIDIEGTTYNWRVSATALSNKYSISGLPESAVFVGIRLTAA